MKTARQGQFASLGAAVLFGCSAPLVSTLTGSGSALSIAGLLYAGATLALLAVRLVRGSRGRPGLMAVASGPWPGFGHEPGKRLGHCSRGQAHGLQSKQTGRVVREFRCAALCGASSPAWN